MRGCRVHCILVALFLTALAAGFSISYDESGFSSHSEPSSYDVSLSDSIESGWTGAEAAKHWRQAEPAMIVQDDIKSASGILRPVVGNYDPLIDHTPNASVPTILLDEHDAERTGIIIVQLVSKDSSEFLLTAEQRGLTVLDSLPDEAWLVRLPSDGTASATIATLRSAEEVRWFGSQPAVWRLAENLHPLTNLNTTLAAAVLENVGGTIDLDLTPAPDVASIELLETDLYDLGAESVRCDAWLCQVREIPTSTISDIALDGRLLFTTAANPIILANSYARQITRVDEVIANHNSNLDGTGQVGAISDTGLDQDHGDFTSRIRAVYNQYGPDNSGADMNSGHGTHVSASMLGDGSGDGSQEGVAPAATFHFYQMEHDSSGSLARWGSLYDMFRHSWQQNARVQSNSWGAENAGGDYSSDSRSADMFADDYEDFLILFAAGNEGSQGATSISPPSTAKNVLAIGASTTGRPGTASAGQVASFSSIGMTDDGRIKPDLVAPGVQICSARAEEARFPAGPSCSSSRHTDGSTPLYMSADGTSAATPIAAGTALLTRQFLSDELSISQPRSDLMRAMLINGAADIGNKDIPNANEGWGQIDLANTLYPRDGVLSLNTFYDWNQTLSPGYSYVYTYDLDASHGLDITVVWNDREGSSSAAQSAKRLMNDLDLEVTSPDATIYKGNVFSSGFSTSGGAFDDTNVVERVRLSTGPVGNWSIKVKHGGGATQGYSIVITAIGNENPMSDLSVFDGSLWSSMDYPLEGDRIALTAAWINQAPATTPAYRVVLEDETAGVIIWNGTRSPLGGGDADSFATQHQFTTTGVHSLKLTLDVDDDVVEINDAGVGVDNNIIRYNINVTAIGVRIIPHNPDGSVPTTTEARAAALNRQLDPTLASNISIDFTLANEGTATTDIGLSVTPVQIIRDDGVLDNPGDEWQKYLSDEGPWTLVPSGTSGDSVNVRLELRDLSADINADGGARYALPGLHIIDLTLYDRQQPIISHTVRVTVDILRVEGILTQLAGDTGLAAKPGEAGSFTLSVLNTGNGPTSYSVSCDSPNRWSIEIGNGNSSSLVMEALVRLQGLPLNIRVNVPPAVSGLPAAGVTETITCITSSLVNSALSTTEVATLTVLQSNDFEIEMFDEQGEPIGPGALAENRAVLNGQTTNTTIVLSNLGNIQIVLDVVVNSGLNTWGVQLMQSGTGSDMVSVTLPAGETRQVLLQVVVPLAAEMLTQNDVTVRVTLSGEPAVTNRTAFIVEERATFSLTGPESGTILTALGETGMAVLSVHNTGNTELSLTWTIGTLPDGWQVGFLSQVPNILSMNRLETVDLGLVLPAQLPAGVQSESVPIIVTGITPNGDEMVQTIDLAVHIPASAWAVLDSNLSRIDSISRDGEPTGHTLTVRNDGNIPMQVALSASALEGWTVTFEPATINILAAGDSRIVSMNIIASEDANAGLNELTILATVSAGEGVTMTNGSLIIEIAASNNGPAGGVFGKLESLGIPTWATGLVAFASLVMFAGAIFTIRNRGLNQLNAGEELVQPGFSGALGAVASRKEMALNVGEAESGAASGTVSDDEVAAALAASGPPGLTPDGLPPGLPPGLTTNAATGQNPTSPQGLTQNIPAGLPPGMPGSPPPPSSFQKTRK